MSKLLTIFGVTGQQSGSVIKTFQSTPALASAWKLRAVTRDTSSPSSIALSSSGVQVVSADFNKPETLAKALEGSYAAFINTLTTKESQNEVKQGKSIVDACLAANVKHLAWSGVPSPKRVTNGKLQNVIHFETKFNVTEYIESVKGNKIISSYFEPASFFPNFEYQLKPDDQGIRTLRVPYGNGDTVKLPYINTSNDSGVYVAALLSTDAKISNGFRAQAVTEWISANEIARTLTEVTGKPFKYAEITSERYSSFMPEPMQVAHKEMSDIHRDYHYYGVGAEKKQAEIDAALGIKRKSTLAQWAKDSKAIQAIM